jgi:hypothetical protein
LAGPAGLLLGVDPDAAYTDATALLPAGCTLVLATDGLVDDGPRAVHPGDAAFADRLAMLTTGDGPEAAVDVLVDALVAPGADAGAQRDDAAVLVARLAPVPAPGAVGAPDGAHRVFRPVPQSAPAARRFVRDLLAGWGLARLTHPATLAVSELVTNTVLHTASPIHLTVRRTGPDRVWIGVYDDCDRSVRPPRPAGDDVSGRGLLVVGVLAERWGVVPATAGSGKTVWLEITGTSPGALPRNEIHLPARPDPNVEAPAPRPASARRPPGPARTHDTGLVPVP